MCAERNVEQRHAARRRIEDALSGHRRCTRHHSRAFSTVFSTCFIPRTSTFLATFPVPCDLPRRLLSFPTFVRFLDVDAGERERRIIELRKQNFAASWPDDDDIKAFNWLRVGVMAISFDLQHLLRCASACSNLGTQRFPPQPTFLAPPHPP